MGWSNHRRVAGAFVSAKRARRVPSRLPAGRACTRGACFGCLGRAPMSLAPPLCTTCTAAGAASSGGRGRASSAAACPSFGCRTPTSSCLFMRPPWPAARVRTRAAEALSMRLCWWMKGAGGKFLPPIQTGTGLSRRSPLVFRPLISRPARFSPRRERSVDRPSKNTVVVRLRPPIHVP